MTPAIDFLTKQKVAFTVLQYQHDSSNQAFGLEAVEKLNLNAEHVFKTLVICDETSTLAVAIVPVNKMLNLKAAAKALKVKKIVMADAKRVTAVTGYVLGGVSPLGQKKKLVTLIDSSAQNFNKVYISGGKRGLEIALSPQDLCLLCKASFVTMSA